MQSSRFRCKYHPFHNSIGVCPVCLTKQLLELMLENDEYIESALEATSPCRSTAPQEIRPDFSKDNCNTINTSTQCDFQSSVIREEPIYVKQDTKQPFSHVWHPTSPSSCPLQPSPLHHTAFCSPSRPHGAHSTENLHASMSLSGSQPPDYQINYIYKGATHPSQASPTKKNSSYSHKAPSYTSLWSLITPKRARSSKTARSSHMREAVENPKEQVQTQEEVYHPKDHAKSAGSPSLHGIMGSWFSSLLSKKGKRSSKKTQMYADSVWEYDEWTYGRHSSDRFVAHTPAAVAHALVGGRRSAHARGKGNSIATLLKLKGGKDPKQNIDGYAGGAFRKHDDDADSWIYGRHSVDRYIATPGASASPLLFSTTGNYNFNTDTREHSLLRMQRKQVISPPVAGTPLCMTSPDLYAAEAPRRSLDGAPARFFKNSAPIASILKKQTKSMTDPMFSPDFYAMQAPQHSLDSAADVFSMEHSKATGLSRKQERVMESPDVSAIGTTARPDQHITAAWPRFSGVNTATSGSIDSSIDNLLNVSSGMTGPKQFASAAPPRLSLDYSASADDFKQKSSAAAGFLQQQSKMQVVPADIAHGRIGRDLYANIALRLHEKPSSNSAAAANYTNGIPTGSLPKKQRLDAAYSSSDRFSNHPAEGSDYYTTPTASQSSAEAATMSVTQKRRVISPAEIMIIPESCTHLVSTTGSLTCSGVTSVHVNSCCPCSDHSRFHTIIATSRHSVDGSSCTSLLSRS